MGETATRPQDLIRSVKVDSSCNQKCLALDHPTDEPMSKGNLLKTDSKDAQFFHTRTISLWVLWLLCCLMGPAGYARFAGVAEKEYQEFAKDLINRSVFKNSQCSVSEPFSVVDVTDNIIDIYLSRAISEKCQSLLQKRIASGFSYEWEGSLYQFSTPAGSPNTLRVSTGIKVEQPIMETNFGAWAKINTDGSWTQAASNSAWHSTLPFSVPRDIEKFCPAYTKRTYGERAYFWAALISAMARPESNFNPAAEYIESFLDREGNPVVSRGLLQLSIESSLGYQCDAKANVKTAQDLHDPVKNIACTSVILDKWVNADNIIATYGPKDARPSGGGRYWSVLREGNGHLPEIMAFTRSLGVCK
jgi:hypothetical protein